MRRPPQPPLRMVTATLAAACIASLAACGGSSDTPGSAAGAASPGPVTVEGVGQVSPDPALAAALPGDVKAKGVLTVATNAPYAPFIEFKVQGRTDQFKGLDHDLLQALSAKLGIRVRFVQQPFDGLVTGLQAGKYDAIAGGVTDTRERQQVATFVDYNASGTGLMVRKGNPEGIRDLATLCGRGVAVQKASRQQKALENHSRTSCGGNPVKVTAYPGNSDAQQALLAGRVSVFAATKVNIVDQAAKAADKVEVVDDPAQPNGYWASPNGIGFLKAKADLAKAYQRALQTLIDDGTYGRILAKYKQEATAVKTATIDKAVD